MSSDIRKKKAFVGLSVKMVILNPPPPAYCSCSFDSTMRQIGEGMIVINKEIALETSKQ